MNTTVKTNLAPAAAAISLSVVAPDAAHAVPTVPMGRQIAPSDFAMRGGYIAQQFMPFGSQAFPLDMAMPHP